MILLCVWLVGLILTAALAGVVLGWLWAAARIRSALVRAARAERLLLLAHSQMEALTGGALASPAESLDLFLTAAERRGVLGD